MTQHFESLGKNKVTSHNILQVSPTARHIMTVFNRRFSAQASERTQLVPSASEPEYIPAADDGSHHRICFANGFASSALHETAHWCIAGRARRALYDYGYWYVPDGRTKHQQEEFFAVEVKPQSLEWLFSLAVGIPFFISCDNLSGDGADLDRMRNAVWTQTVTFLNKGLPQRAAIFLNDLLASTNRSKEYHRLILGITQGDITPS